MATPADVGHRTLDDIACRINDEAQATPAMKKGEAKIPGVSIEATLAQARDLSLVHQRLNERRLDRESRGDDAASMRTASCSNSTLLIRSMPPQSFLLPGWASSDWARLSRIRL